MGFLPEFGLFQVVFCHLIANNFSYLCAFKNLYSNQFYISGFI